MVYLDNAATTRISDAVLQNMLPYLRIGYGNPGSVHTLGRQSFEAVETARQRVAFLLEVPAQNIIFTASATEANNMVLRCTRERLRERPDIVVSAGEHDSILRTAFDVERREKGHVFKVPLMESGRIDTLALMDIVERHRDSIGLVSIMRANNETGAVNPVENIFPKLQSLGILTHSDCVQAAGTEPLEHISHVCDFITLSAHKIHGPKGVGALYVKDKEALVPLITGGSVQEYGLRGGTENVAGIVGFGKACELASKNLAENVQNINMKSGKFFSVLTEQLARMGLIDILHFNGESQNSKTYSIRFDGIPAETLLMMLDANEIYVSAGSACTAHDTGLSHVLSAMGLSPEEIRSSIRISFSTMNTMDEMLFAACGLATCVQRIHKSL